MFVGSISAGNAFEVKRKGSRGGDGGVPVEKSVLPGGYKEEILTLSWV